MPLDLALEDLHERNKSFTAEVPGLQYAWDNTSLSYLRECPRKYFYSMILGIEPQAYNIHFEFGNGIHTALELYDKEIAKGSNHEAALRAATKHAYRHKFNAEETSTKNRQTLVRSVVWYLEHFRNDPFKTLVLANGEPAVELSFRYELPDFAPNGSPYLLCGHLDRVVDFNDAIWATDRKTTGHQLNDSYFAQYGTSTQMSQYSIATTVYFGEQARGVIIDAMQLQVGATKFARKHAHRNAAQLEEFLDDTLYFIGEAERYAERKHWPKNESSCTKFGACPFLPVCSRPPQTRDLIINSDYKAKMWDPLEVR